MLGLSLLAMSAAWCGFAATIFAKPAVDPVLKEIKVESVEVKNSRASQEPALMEIENKVPGLAAQLG